MNRRERREMQRAYAVQQRRRRKAIQRRIQFLEGLHSNEPEDIFRYLCDEKPASSSLLMIMDMMSILQDVDHPNKDTYLSAAEVILMALDSNEERIIRQRVGIPVQVPINMVTLGLRDHVPEKTDDNEEVTQQPE